MKLLNQIKTLKVVIEFAESYHTANTIKFCSFYDWCQAYGEYRIVLRYRYERENYRKLKGYQNQQKFPRLLPQFHDGED